MCRFCLSQQDSEEKALFPLDLQMSILEMGNGEKVTISDALKYIDLDVIIPADEIKGKKDYQKDDSSDELEVNNEKEGDHPELPKSLCQECLDKLQSIYEFKYRVIENREYLRGYVKDLAEAKDAEERAARQAIAQELDIDLNNLDNLPDKLVLKPQLKKQRKPRKTRDPDEEPPQKQRKRRLPDKSVIIAEDSQVETAVYVRKVVTTPEKSPDQKHSSKRKSKHVIIEDIAVGEKPKPLKYDRHTRKKEPLYDENNRNESNSSETELAETSLNSTSAPKDKIRHIDEPIFEDDDDFEEEIKRTRKSRK